MLFLLYREKRGLYNNPETASVRCIRLAKVGALFLVTRVSVLAGLPAFASHKSSKLKILWTIKGGRAQIVMKVNTIIAVDWTT